MKRFYATLSLVLLGATMLSTQAAERGRNGNSQNSSEKREVRERPGNMGQGNGTTRRPETRPGNNGNNTDKNNRPSHGNNPGYNWNNNNNQGNHGNNNNWNHGNNNHGNNNHGNQHWNNGHSHGTRPGYLPNHYHGAWHRPTPPAHWHASSSWRPFRSILGIALGTAFDIALNQLMFQGVNVNYYGDNTIYLSDVRMLNLDWPDAIMYYDSYGGLRGSRFMYSTSRHNMKRYEKVYSQLVRNYGYPAQVNNSRNGAEASWWGPSGQFIRLTYNSEFAPNGRPMFYTTLSFGD